MPVQATSGAATYDAFGGGVPVVPNYIEDVFSTWLYTGNGSTQTITNGIDLAGKGGLVWFKGRTGTINHSLYDTARGREWSLATNVTTQQEGPSSSTQDLTSFNSNGFSLGTPYWSPANNNGVSSVSWTFREQAKFFDVVTYTGNGVAGRTVAHNLGAVPGCMIVKRTDGATNWRVYHRSLGATQYLDLDETASAGTATTIWNDTAPTSTVFSVGTNSGVNANGGTYVAYLFAHDAGGFGLTGTDNVISCGSYTGNGSTTGPVIDLGYEPQWLLIKRTTNGIGDWWMFDSMRGLTMTIDADLRANLSQAEEAVVNYINPTATGFNLQSATAGLNASGSNYIYIAIRRGPMKTPTSGTSVFSPQTSYTVDGSGNALVTTGFPVDAFFWTKQSIVENKFLTARLLGMTDGITNTTDAFANNLAVFWASNTQVAQSAATTGNQIYECLRRAPGFFDVVCFTTDGSGNYTGNHNLSVTPELIITKRRNGTGQWWTYCAYSGTSPLQRWLLLNDVNGASGTGTAWWATSATSFSTLNGLLAASATNVAYLFASCPGVSKVGSYTGTGTTKQIDCGFTAGSRFVLIKRTDNDGDWYVWDSARGIVAGNDPYLLLNSTAAEVTSTDYIDTYSAGFEISSTAPAAINANGGTFIFLAIA